MSTGTRRLLAIGLDAADPEVLERWMGDGKLPGLAGLREQGAWGRIAGPAHHRAETPWSEFLSGVSPETSGFWGDISMADGSSQPKEIGADDFVDFPPFYALGPGCRVAVLDVPKTRIVNEVDGIQLVAWGAHSPGAAQGSRPEGLLRELEQRHGTHPALLRDDGEWWDARYMRTLHRNLLTGIRRRTAVVEDILAREAWDLVLTAFGETHSAGHDFWHLSQADHPLAGMDIPVRFASDPMLEVYQAVDQAVAELAGSLPDDTAVCVFSLHGSGPNSTDMPSLAVLPELLFRHAFPGKSFFQNRQVSGEPPPPVTRGLQRSWTEVIWRMRQDPLRWRGWLRSWLPIRWNDGFDRLFGSGLPPGPASPNRLRAEGDPFFWQPCSWYQPFWPEMKAFALPSYSEGMVRINVAGRDPQGIVAAADYERCCAQISALMMELRCGRSGLPAVEAVFPCRRSARDGEKAPSADLIVRWCDRATDVWDHPHLGRIGPLPFRRTGSHRSQGFLCLRMPGIEAGSKLAEGRLVDLAPTLLDILGKAPAARFEGVSLLPVSAS